MASLCDGDELVERFALGDAQMRDRELARASGLAFSPTQIYLKGLHLVSHKLNPSTERGGMAGAHVP